MRKFKKRLKTIVIFLLAIIFLVNVNIDFSSKQINSIFSMCNKVYAENPWEDVECIYLSSQFESEYDNYNLVSIESIYVNNSTLYVKVCNDGSYITKSYNMTNYKYRIQLGVSRYCSLTMNDNSTVILPKGIYTYLVPSSAIKSISCIGTRFSYALANVTIQRQLNTEPIINVSLPLINSFYNQSDFISLSGSISDPDLGDILKVFYRIDGLAGQTGIQIDNNITADGSNKSYNGVISTASINQGSHTIYQWVEDNVGGKSVEVSKPITIDNTPPITTPRSYNITTNKLEITGPPCTDAISGLLSIQYRYSLGTKASQWTQDLNHIIYDLNPNTQYTAKFEVQDLVGNIAEETKSVFTKAEIPIITVSTKRSNTIEISAADNNPDITDYQITCGTKYINQSGILVDTPIWIKLIDKKINIIGLSPNTKYTFQAKAKNLENIETALSNTLVTETITPTPVFNTPISSSTSIAVNWSGVSGALSYEVECDGVVRNIGNKLTYVHTGLALDTQHTYRVRAINAYSPSAWSTLITAKTTLAAPGDATNIKSKISNKQIILTWDQVPQSESYSINVDGNGELELGQVNSFIHGNLVPSTTHTYVIKAKNLAGTSIGVTVNATTLQLDTPQNIQSLDGQADVKLTWNAVTGATGYDLEVDGSATYVSVSTASYTRTGTPSEKHQYRIRAKNSIGGYSDWSYMIVGSILPPKPGIPTNIKTIALDSKIVLVWDAVAGADGYDVEIDGVVIDNDNLKSYFDDLLTPNSQHNYRIRAKAQSVEGTWSSSVNVATLPLKTQAPNNIVIQTTSTTAAITWASVIGAAGYLVDINPLLNADGSVTSSTNPEDLINTGTKTSYLHKNLTAGTTKMYRIGSINMFGNITWSGLIINNSLPAVCTKSNNLDLGLTAANITDFSKYTLTVNYKANVLDVIDLCTLTGQKELIAGKIDGTDIEIKEFSPGRIVFVVDKQVNLGESWTGIINSIKFMAKYNGKTSITYTVLNRTVEE